MASIGKIAVQITARTRRFRRSLSRISARLRAFGARVGGVAKILALFTIGLGVAIAVAATVAIKKITDYGDQLGKMAKLTGVTAQELARFKFAAELSGASIEDVEKAIVKAQKSIFDLERGLTETKFAFDELGIGLEDIKRLNPSEQFDLLITRLADMDNISRRNAIGVQLLGRGFKNLAPLLAGGAEGIAKLKAEADRLGLVLDPRQIRAAEDFKDSLARVQGALFGIVAQNTNLEGLTDIFETLSDIVVDLRGSLVGGFGPIGKSVEETGSAVTRLTITLGGFLKAAAKDLPLVGKIIKNAFFAAIGEVGERLEFFVFKEFPNGLKQLAKIIGVLIPAVFLPIRTAFAVVVAQAQKAFDAIGIAFKFAAKGDFLSAAKSLSIGIGQSFAAGFDAGASKAIAIIEGVQKDIDNILRPIAFERSPELQRTFDQLNNDFKQFAKQAGEQADLIQQKLIDLELDRFFGGLDAVIKVDPESVDAIKGFTEALRPAALERGTQAAFSAELDPVTSAIQKTGKEQIAEQQTTNRLLKDIKDDAESTTVVSIPLA